MIYLDANVIIRLVEGTAVIDIAARLRATFNFKSPNAIHLASANQVGATAFLTADRSLGRSADVPVEII